MIKCNECNTTFEEEELYEHKTRDSVTGRYLVDEQCPYCFSTDYKLYDADAEFEYYKDYCYLNGLAVNKPESLKRFMGGGVCQLNHQ